MMMNSKSRFIKTALLMLSFGFTTSNAFSNGTITGMVETNVSKYKKDTVIYLVGVKSTIVPQHKSIDQENLTFVPKITTIPVGSTIRFKNNDKIYHNINSPSGAKQFDLNTYDHQSKSVTFDKPGVVPLLCKVHAEMSGWVIVTDNQYATVTEHDGKFTIANVPAGVYEITAWNEKLKPQGKTMVTVAEGTTDPVVIKMAI